MAEHKYSRADIYKLRGSLASIATAKIPQMRLFALFPFAPKILKYQSDPGSLTTSYGG